MKFEFRHNGETQLIIKPGTNLEREFLNELFSTGEVVVVREPNAVNNAGEIVIKPAHLERKAV